MTLNQEYPLQDSRPDSIAPMPFGQRQHSRGFAARNRQGFDNADLSNIEMPAHWAVPWADLMMVMMVMFAVMLATQLAERDPAELFKPETAIEAATQAAKPRHNQGSASLELAATKDLSASEPMPSQQPSRTEAAAGDPARPPNPEAQVFGAGQESMPGGTIGIEDLMRLSQNLVTAANLDDIDVVLTANQAIKVSVRGNLLFDSGKADLKPEAISFLQQLAQVIAANPYLIEVVGHTDNFPVSSPAFATNWELSAARAARVARYLIQYGKLAPGRFTVIGQSFYRPSVANDSPANKAKNRRVEIIITRYTYDAAASPSLEGTL